MILTREAIDFISQKLSLPFTGVEQDWEIELSDPERVSEFVSFYKKETLSSEEKKALMALIFASYEDLLTEFEVDKNELWLEIVLLIQSDRALFEELLNYWRLDGETSPENYFRITPLVRTIEK